MDFLQPNSMIFEVLQVITEEANSYFEGNPVSLENIATVIDADSGDNQNTTTDIVLSLLNMQEEFTMKNIPNAQINGINIDYRNPKVNLNMFILFSATNSIYTEALKGISKIIEFFQGKSVFTQANSNFVREGDLVNIADFRFNVNLYTPTFEELNFIWGTLGGKQYPSVLYKVSLIELERKDVLAERGGLITETDNQLKNIER